MTKFFRVENLGEALIRHETADCAAIRGPKFSRPAEFALGPQGFRFDALADEEFLANSAQIMDAASFIGFPQSEGASWWDTRTNQPIARMVSLASLPGQPFVNATLPKTLAENVALVSGLSFAGSSGSPLILHSKGFKVTPPLAVTGGSYVPAKIIGLMSGHRVSEDASYRCWRTLACPTSPGRRAFSNCSVHENAEVEKRNQNVTKLD